MKYCATCQTGGKGYADRGVSRLLKEDWARSIDEWEERMGARHALPLMRVHEPQHGLVVRGGARGLEPVAGPGDRHDGITLETVPQFGRDDVEHARAALALQHEDGHGEPAEQLTVERRLILQ